MILTDSYLRGLPVHDISGRKIGKVCGLVMDIPSGRVTYLLIDFQDMPNLIETQFVIPWSLLSYELRLKGFRTDISDVQLNEAPQFNDDRMWEEAVHAHYNIAPYWHKPMLPRERYSLPPHHLDMFRIRSRKLDH